MKSIKVVVYSLVLAILALPTQAEIQFISLYNRTADEVLPTLNYTFPNIAITSYGNQLVINASIQEINQIKATITQLDTPARRLLITIDNADIKQRDTIQLGKKNHSHDRFQINQGQANYNRSSLKQLLVNEGSPILLEIGQSVPMTLNTQDIYGRPIKTTQYQDIMQKVYIIAQVVEQQVFITLTNQNDLYLQQTGQINRQTLDTRVSGQLGAWINVGTLHDKADANNMSYNGYSHTEKAMNTNIRIKVELSSQ